jgi:hypothetical protein
LTYRNVALTCRPVPPTVPEAVLRQSCEGTAKGSTYERGCSEWASGQ